MKKLLAMILTCASLTAFAACGGTSDSTGGANNNGGNNGGAVVDTEVTADEFAAAFNFGANYVAKASLVFEGQGTQYWEWYRAGDLLKSVVDLRNPDGTSFEGKAATENFTEKVGEVVYRYTPTFNAEGTVDFFRKEVGEKTFEFYENEDLSSMLMENMKVFASYTYNADTQAYEAAEIVFSENQKAANVSFKFVDNKLVSGGYTMVMGTTSIPVTFTFSYGGVTITLPTNLQPAA